MCAAGIEEPLRELELAYGSPADVGVAVVSADAAECKLLELLQRAVQYLRSPKISAAAALAFRPLLPQLLAQAFQTHCQSGTPASDWNAKTLICLAEVLVVTPYLHREVADLVMAAPISAELFHMQPETNEEGRADQTHLARSVLRLLQLCPQLHACWGPEPLMHMLTHPIEDVQWCAVEAISILESMEEAVKQQLQTAVLTQDKLTDCQLQWQKDCTRLALVRAAMWTSTTAADGSPPQTDLALIQGLATNDWVQVGGIYLSRKQQHTSALATDTSLHHYLQTPALEQTLRAAAMALSSQQPLLLEGPPDSGKTALMEELARATNKADMICIHVDDQMDAKSLLGAYVTTAVPGEFAWQPGPVTQAAMQGRWLVIEGIDMAPPDVLAALAPLMEARQLHIPQRAQQTAAASGFQLIATVTTNPGGIAAGSFGDAQRVLEVLGSLFAIVRLPALPKLEQQQIIAAAYPAIQGLLPLALASQLLCQLATGQERLSALSHRASWQALALDIISELDMRVANMALLNARFSGVRDLRKWAARMQAMHGQLLLRAGQGQPGPDAQLDATTLPVELREAALLEFQGSCMDMFADSPAKQELLTGLTVLWGLDGSFITGQSLSKPELKASAAELRVGRAVLPVTATNAVLSSLSSVAATAKGTVNKKAPKQAFANTAHTLRIMEAMAAAVSQNEPLLLVGETGTGKTTTVQQLAGRVNARLTVLNLSQHTDSSDLLGGFRPVEARHSIAPLLPIFCTLVQRTWPRGKNEDFLSRIMKAAQRDQWSFVARTVAKAAEKVFAEDSPLASPQQVQTENASGQRRAKRHKATSPDTLREEWQKFRLDLSSAEQALKAAGSGYAFAYMEGELTKAVREGSWLLLDEVNLGPPEALQCIAGLLESNSSSITLNERGDTRPLQRHPGFRLFAAMNPANDAGKRELPGSIRSRFTEMWVAEPSARSDLEGMVAAYLLGTAPQPPIAATVDFYLAAKAAAAIGQLQNGSGCRPTYTLRTLGRALEYARLAVKTYGLQRALYDGAAMAFQTQLQPASMHVLQTLLCQHLLGASHLPKGFLKAPPSPSGAAHVLFEHFWVEAGPAEVPEAASPDFVMTPSISAYLRSMARAILLKRYPILLQGPTSAGKTSMVRELAKQTGHRCVRINNHEGTDLQEYVGSYVTDTTGHFTFQEGALLTAMRQGHWVILDELNLAPSEVLEALNRLLDDNRELYVPELQEAVKPHPHFQLFATQNPAGAYGGRRQLSRAFRSRFLELHIGDIPDNELKTILEVRCAVAPSYAAKLVNVLRTLERHRQGSNIFAGKHGLITPRDLFRWASDGAVGYQQLAETGYMLLAERLRHAGDRMAVQQVLEKEMNVKLNMAALYHSGGAEPAARLQQSLQQSADGDEDAQALQKAASGIVWTHSMRRMYTLVNRAFRQAEPVLLVGETGTGKTTVCQLAALCRGQRLRIVNCNQHTEASDFLGSFRPARNRERAVQELRMALQHAGELHCRQSVHSHAWPELAEELTPPQMAAAAAHAVQELQQLVASRHQPDVTATLQAAAQRVQQAAAAGAATLIEWADGPLVQAMKQGDILLIDELNLADDAVLERLNSVLEPGRTLLLAEKGGAGAEEVVAHPDFRLAATMNPGDDFGKRELSPALANRFTSVWVPALEDLGELGDILTARLAGDDAKQDLAPRLLSFWQFYHSAAPPLAKAALSVRDLLAWAGFINAVGPRIGLWAAYAHGAYLILLDGIGLGLGMAPQAVLTLRHKCTQLLLQQLPPKQQAAVHAASGHPSTNASAESDEAEMVDVAIPDGHWGIAPFFVECALADPYAAPRGPEFEFRAPTAAHNALRILRALQLSKAVLLEGSPGVGKSSIVAAMARAAGRRLVRVNLSEQTDMMDLLGADLPASGGQVGHFSWCDGPLLSALTAGDWVLLDELNLASQSVLEGLNAVLDHRAEVFIPELGRTFRCPPSFRLFAAQNPLQEGGGRRGLPRSFLNRFTRVHISAMQTSDLVFIAESLYPQLQSNLLQRMVSFVQALHAATNVTHSFGASGGPWEFNLRDLLRWCRLITSGTASHRGDGKPGQQEHKAARTAGVLFKQRLRSAEDRSQVEQLYAQAFGQPLQDAGRFDVAISEDTVMVGQVAVQRLQQPIPGGIQQWYHQSRRHQATVQEDSLLLRGQLPALEAQLLCIQHGWMSLLVGRSGTGKTTLARQTAQLCGRCLVEIALTGGTDTSDLLGSFEQVDAHRHLQEAVDLIDALRLYLVQQALTDFQHDSRDDRESYVAAVLQTSQHWQAVLSSVRSGSPAQVEQSGSLLMQSLRSLVEMIAAGARPMLAETNWKWDLLEQLQQAEDGMAALLRGLDSLKAAQGGRFEWVDGPLTRAIELGQWVLLENANLCNPAVLDRLNSLFEPGGSLLLNEAGTAEGQARLLQPHPDFRLFMTLDPRNGEVSQAMRNRGIELCLLPSVSEHSAGGEPGTRLPVSALCTTSDDERVLAAQGVPGHALTHAMATAHAELVSAAPAFRQPTRRELRSWAQLTELLLQQGWAADRALQQAFQQAYAAFAKQPEAMQALITAQVLPALQQSRQASRMQPCLWPIPTTCSAILKDSVHAPGMADGAVVESLCAHSLSQAAQHAPPLGQQQHAWVAAALPVSPPGQAWDMAAQDMCMRLLWAALACYVQRRLANDDDLRAKWAANLSTVLEAAGRQIPDHGKLYLQAAVAAINLVPDKLEAEWRQGMQQLHSAAQESLGQDWPVRALPLDLTLISAVQWSPANLASSNAMESADTLSCQAELFRRSEALMAWHTLAVGSPAVPLAASAASVYQRAQVRFHRPEVRAHSQAEHPVVDWLPALLSALGCLEQVVLSSSKSHACGKHEVLDQMEDMLKWHAALWHLVHGSALSVGSLEAATLALEPLTFVWLRLNKTYSQLAHLASDHPDWKPAFDRLSFVAKQVHTALGLDGAQPSKPLLWKHGGHPQLPCTLKLCRAQNRLNTLIDLLFRHTASGQQEIWMQAVARAEIQSPTVPHDAGADDVMSDGAAGATDVTSAAAAVLAANVKLKQQVVQGLALFGIAAVQRQSKDSQQALEIANALQTNIASKWQQAVDDLNANDIETGMLQMPLSSTSVTAEHLPELFTSQQLVLPHLLILQDGLVTLQDSASLAQCLQLLASQAGLLLQSAAWADGAWQGLREAAEQHISRQLSRQGSLTFLAAQQQLSWLLDGSTAEDAAQAGACILVQDCWHQWHQSFNASSISGLPAATQQLHLTAGVLDGHTVTLAGRAPKAQQLQLAARHMAGWCTELGRKSDKHSARGQWSALTHLLAHVLHAHLPSLPTELADAAMLATSKLLKHAIHGQQNGTRKEDILRQLSAGFAPTSHQVFADILPAALLPCADLVLMHGPQFTATAVSPLDDAIARGKAWALLGLARLHLVQLPKGEDPAGKAALKQAHLHRIVAQELLPELQAHQMFQQVPVGPDETPRISKVQQRIDAMQARAAALEHKLVPRPTPGQYMDVTAEVQRFVGAMGDLDRVLGLLQGLQAGLQAAQQEAAAWQQNATAWTERLLNTHPAYRDLLQPVCLAVLELATGISMLAGAAAASHQSRNTAGLAEGVAQLMTPPELDSGAANRVLVQSQANTTIEARAAEQGGNAKFAARLVLLRTGLQRAVQAAQHSLGSPQALQQVDAAMQRIAAAWEDIKAAAEQHKAEEAELFRSKPLEKAEEEQAEAEYRRRFPNHFAAFADLAEDDLDLTADPPAQQSVLVTASQASSSQAQALLTGEFLDDIVQLHMSLFPVNPEPAGQPDSISKQEAFVRAYDLAARAVQTRGEGQQLWLEASSAPGLAGGLLLRVCMTHQSLAAAPTQEPLPGRGSLDVQKAGAAVGEAELLLDPLWQLQERLRQLLADWPEHPLLSQLLAICTRIQNLPCASPLRTVMTGAEQLLSKAQLWQQTAASHVSLGPQLTPLAALTQRWRRLELLSWQQVLTHAQERHAAGAHQAWFHLHGLLSTLQSEAAASSGSLAQGFAAAVEQFLQSATVGEFARRLDMVQTLRRKLSATVEQGSAQQEGGGAAVLANLHSYYSQFLSLVQAAVTSGIAPLEKSLQDFVKLAKWEDRGFYAQQQATEKAHRQLHSTATKAEGVLKQPAAAVLASSAKAMGLDDLPPEAAPDAQPPASSKRKAEQTDVEAERVAQVQAVWRQWQAAQAAPLPPTFGSPAAADVQPALRQHRLPELTSRLAQVLAPSVKPDSSPAAGAQAIDELAAEAAQRATELRTLTAKGARLRKKKALTDFLDALQAAGASRFASAVPLHDRSVHAWFAQAVPDDGIGHLLDTDIQSSSSSERHEWNRANTYFYQSIARLQRLWQAAGNPHQDISTRECDIAQRLCEHLLYRLRCQRTTLGNSGRHQQQLAQLCSDLHDFASAGHTGIPAQAATQLQLSQAEQQLERLHNLSLGTARLLHACASAESAPERHILLQDAAKDADAIGALMQSQLAHIVPFSRAAHQPVIPAAAAALQSAKQVIIDCSRRTADTSPVYTAQAPGWARLDETLQEASRAAAAWGQAHGSLQPVSAEAISSTAAQWSDSVEQALESSLLWAQGVSAAHANSAGSQDSLDGAPGDVPASISTAEAQLGVAAQPQRMAALCSSHAQLLPRLAVLGDLRLSVTAHNPELLSEVDGLAQCMLSQAAALQHMLRYVLLSHRALASRQLALHKASAKLCYVATALLAGVIEQGFCTAPETSEEGVAGAGGNFKEAEGTGMGEGEGRKDVSDQLENEDQLLGAKRPDQPEEKGKEEEQAGQQQEAAKGIEMNEDFEGALEDVPQEDRDADSGGDDSADEGQLEQQMGEVGPEGEAVDERMWGPQDEAETQQQPQQQQADAAPVQVQDKSQLEYQAGQEAEEAADSDRPEGPDEAQRQGQPEAEEQAREDDGKASPQEAGPQQQGQEHLKPEGPPEELDVQQQEAAEADAEVEADAAHEAEATEAAAQQQPAGAEKLDEGDRDMQDAEQQQAEQLQQELPEELDMHMSEGEAEGGEREAAEANSGDEAEQADADIVTEAQGGAAEEQPQPEGVAVPSGASGLQPGAASGPEQDGGGGQQQLQTAAQEATAGAVGQQEQGMEAESSQAGGAQGTRAAEAGARAAPGDRAAPPKPLSRVREANPLRSLGDAVERWKANLSLEGGEALEGQEAAPEAGEADADEQQQQFGFDASDEQPGPQTLAPATQEQARAQGPLPLAEHEDDVIAEPPPEGDDEQLPDQLPPALQVEQALAAAEQQQQGQPMAAVTEQLQDDDMQEGQEAAEEVQEAEQQPRPTADDSFVADFMTRASLAEDGEAGLELPLPEEVAAQLRSQLSAQLAEAAPESEEAALELGRQVWARCEALTSGLAGELTEGLRQLLEPTRARRLAGDYRSGKRLAMRKVIAFIASNFRRDKIWMRRTRPDQRQYQVVIALDDSRSMGESGCGGFACEAVVLLARALARLEVGSLGILRFGGAGAVQQLHPLDRPFTDADGPRILSHLRFDRDNTIADRPMMELVAAVSHLLEAARSTAAAGGQAPAGAALHQLVLIVADGRFTERDALRRIVAETSERPGVLMAFIVLDSPAASLLDMRTVSFVEGQPRFSSYLEAFPFPYYIVLRDIAALPATLAGLVRQWMQLSTP